MESDLIADLAATRKVKCLLLQSVTHQSCDHVMLSFRYESYIPYSSRDIPLNSVSGAWGVLL